MIEGAPVPLDPAAVSLSAASADAGNAGIFSGALAGVPGRVGAGAAAGAASSSDASPSARGISSLLGALGHWAD
ncbi:MAG: hypothetical protein H6708_34415 [Kofleriaceae bacterium]|nr:hypothetical protein [Kofleriaceae bacterium]